MKLRKKILLSVSCIIFGALIILLFVGGSVLRSFSKKYEPLSYQIVDKNVFLAEDILNSFDSKRDGFKLLDQNLKSIGYQLFVLKFDAVIYASPEPEDPDWSEKLRSLAWDEGQTRLYSVAGVTVIGEKQNRNLIIAQCMREQEQMKDIKSVRMETVLITFLTVGIISIGIILIISQIFTQYLAKHIMKPVHALEKGAMRIQEGILTVPIEYGGADEFHTVCTVFNQMQTHLKKEQERNAAYEKARTDMVTGISHDLRTPLTSMKGYIKGILDGVASTSEKKEQYLSIAYRKACDMDILLQKLFYFSKMETGNLLLELRNTDLGEFARRFERGISEELRHIGGSVKVECMGGVHIVKIDEEQIYRVLANLLENAQKYAKAEALKITIKVWSGTDIEYLSFADNGIGITSEQIPRIFEQFWRGDEARSSQNEKGSGLGLYIVKYIVEAHGGSIMVNSDQGLQFIIALPKVKEESDVSYTNRGG